MKKHLFIIISMIAFAVNASAANKTAFFAYQAFYGGILPASVCTASAPDWMGNVINIDFGNRDVTYPKETIWEGTWRFLTGIDNRIGYDQFGNAYKHIQPITGTPPIPGFAKGASIIKTGAKIVSKTKTLQTGGHILKNSTLKALKLTKEQANKAIHALKKDWRLPPNAHYKIMSDGSVINPNTGFNYGKLYDYLP